MSLLDELRAAPEGSIFHVKSNGTTGSYTPACRWVKGGSKWELQYIHDLITAAGRRNSDGSVPTDRIWGSVRIANWASGMQRAFWMYIEPGNNSIEILLEVTSGQSSDSPV